MASQQESDDHRALSRRALRQKLEGLQGAGVTHLPKRQNTSAQRMPTADVPTAPPVKSAEAAPIPRHPAAARPPSQLVQLDLVRHEVTACVKCPHLAAARTQTVFGAGNPRARLCFIGEAPGADEDRLGEPFVGRAGQLLDKVIEACTLKRGDVYVLNVLKCRPPENRPPRPDEIANCRGYLERQLAILQPEYICCLGATAAQALLNTDESIGKLRGRFHKFDRATVLCTYHPSYLLRVPSAKRDVWEDMKVLMRAMGVELA